MRQWLVLLLIAGMFSFLKGDNTKGKFSLGIKGGLSAYFGDIDKRMPRPTAGIQAYYWPTSVFGLGLDGGYTQLESDDDLNYFKADIYYGAALLKFKLFPSASVNPCLGFGFEALSVDSKGKDGNWLPNRRLGKYDKMQYAIPVNASLSVFLVEEVLALDIEVTHHQMLADYLDDLKVGDRPDSYLTGILGLSFYFGKSLDSDRDGIPDKKDGDPYHPEDIDGFKDGDGIPDPDNDGDQILDIDDKDPNNPEDLDGFEDKDGAPDPDNDGDGILDEFDKCPDQPEDKDGFQDEDGCPDPDNDNDGIEDEFDKCPNDAEDFDGFADRDGCPDIDNDGDGIPDSVDNCPNDAETLNGINDNDGCPDSVTTELPDKFNLSADEIFDPNSAQIKFEAKGILDNVISILRKHPGVNWRIEGHMDTRGSENFMRTLSFERAKAVLEYFAEFGGLNKAYFEIFGMGDKFPVGNNNTEIGRKQNRRIEIIKVE